MKKFAIPAVALAATLGLVLASGLTSAADPVDAGTIKKVMKEAMKGGLQKKVASGKATDDQKKELLALYEDLAKATPPRGSEADWKLKADALVVAAKDVVAGKAGATSALNSAANCKACHDAHKGK